MDPFHLFLNETVADADTGGQPDVEAGADAVGDAGAAVDPVVEAPTPAPDWRTSPEYAAEIARAREDALNGFLEQFAGDDEPQGPPELDPFADDFAAQLQARDEWLTQQFESKLNERLGAVQPVVDQHYEAQGQEIIQAKFAEWAPTLGSFDHEAAERASYGFLREVNGDPEAALRKGAEYAAALRKSEREAGKTEYIASLTADGSTLLDPAVNGSGLEGQPQYRDEEEAARAFFARTTV